MQTRKLSCVTEFPGDTKFYTRSDHHQDILCVQVLMRLYGMKLRLDGETREQLTYLDIVEKQDETKVNDDNHQEAWLHDNVLVTNKNEEWKLNQLTMELNIDCILYFDTIISQKPYLPGIMIVRPSI